MELYRKLKGYGGIYDDVDEVIKGLGSADVVVGIPSRNVAHIVNYVIYNVALGIKKYYGTINAAILVCDGLSSDGTPKVIKVFRKYLDLPTYVLPNIVSKGKGGALRTIIELVHRYSDSKALLLIDSDLRSITPEWVPLLLEGAKRYGFVTPLYKRHKFDATITNFVARPITSMAYGIDIKQPIGGDFGLSRGLVNALAKAPWGLNPWSYFFGVDIFITHTALAKGFTVCEAFLKAKIHEPKDPAKELKGMFMEVTGSLFTSLKIYEDSWVSKEVSGLTEPPLIKEPEPPDMPPWEVKISKGRALKVFREGLLKFKEVLSKSLTTDLLRTVYKSKEGLDSDVWAEVCAYMFRYFIRSEDVNSLKALYHLWQGRLINYYDEVSWSEDVSEVLLREVKEFLNIRDLFKEFMMGR